MATQQTVASEQFIWVPFPVLFMRVFDNADEARELLEVVTRFLFAKKLNILKAQVIESEFGDEKRYTPYVAWPGGNFGVTQFQHTGFQFYYRFDPYTSDAQPEKSPTAIHGEFFMRHWRVRVPMRLVAIEVEDVNATEEEEVA